MPFAASILCRFLPCLGNLVRSGDIRMRIIAPLLTLEGRRLTTSRSRMTCIGKGSTPAKVSGGSSTCRSSQYSQIEWELSDWYLGEAETGQSEQDPGEHWSEQTSWTQ